jgi:hypothetical protein
MKANDCNPVPSSFYPVGGYWSDALWMLFTGALSRDE